MIASPNPWFYRGWLSTHSLRCLGVSAVWCWTSAMVLSCYEIFDGEQEIAVLVLIVGSLAAMIVSTLFSLLIYPALQGLLQVLTPSYPQHLELNYQWDLRENETPQTDHKVRVLLAMLF